MSSLTYIGTSLGDLIEMEGINDVFKNSHTADHPLIVGAAKSCVGHTETSSGLVGLVKALASLSRRSVPGLTHLTASNLNPNIDCNLIPMHIPHQPVELPKTSNPLRALVLYVLFTRLRSPLLTAPWQSLRICWYHCWCCN